MNGTSNYSDSAAAILSVINVNVTGNSKYHIYPQDYISRNFSFRNVRSERLPNFVRTIHYYVLAQSCTVSSKIIHFNVGCSCSIVRDSLFVYCSVFLTAQAAFAAVVGAAATAAASAPEKDLPDVPQIVLFVGCNTRNGIKFCN
jgi:hypothetical protein